MMMNSNIPFIIIISLACLCVLYSFSATTFNWFWHEQPSWRIVRNQCIIWTFIIIISNILYEYVNNNFIALLPVSILSIIITTYHLIETRHTIVEGGPDPTTTTTIITKNTSNTNTNNNNDNVQDRNNVIVITGANTGIGKEAARQLAKNEYDTVLLLCRNVTKGNKAANEIRKDTANNNVHVIQCDLSSFASVRNAVQKIRNEYTTINILINNAGLMMKEYQTTIDGNEVCIQANHLGHFLLTSLLLPIIVQEENGKLINVTSSTYPYCVKQFKVSTDYLQCKSNNRKYTLFGQYSITKFCNILHAMYLKDVVYTAAVHPGCVRTDVVRNMPFYFRIPNQLFAFILKTIQKTPKQGAWSILQHTMYNNNNNNNENTSTEVNTNNNNKMSGLYWVNRKPQSIINNMKSVQLDQLAKQLWDWSIEQVQLTNDERIALNETLSSRRDCDKKSQ